MWKICSRKDFVIDDFVLPDDSQNLTQTAQVEHIKSFLNSPVLSHRGRYLSMHATYILILVFIVSILFFHALLLSLPKDVVAMGN